MAEIVNLRMARKRKTRADREQAAQDNRILHGRGKAERLASKAQRERETSLHEAHRREERDD